MVKKKFNLLAFLICIAIPLFAGITVGLLTSNSTEVYQSVVRPSFSPPAAVFPIVWGILYTLMGVSLYLVYASGGTASDYILFFLQLVLNLLWPFIFFNAQAFTVAFVCLVALWIAILLMILSFKKISPVAAYIQIPYLLWVTFAGVLNLSVAILN